LIFRHKSDCQRPELAQRLAQSESRMVPTAFFAAQNCNKAGMFLQHRTVGAELFDQLIQIELSVTPAAAALRGDAFTGIS